MWPCMVGTTIHRIHEEDLPTQLSKVISKQAEIKEKLDKLLELKIEILEKAGQYSQAVDKEGVEIQCPACGMNISKEDFEEHVRGELEGLRQICFSRDEANELKRLLRESVSRVLFHPFHLAALIIQ